MLKIIAAALAITLALSMTVIYFRTTGFVSSEEKSYKEKTDFVELGIVEIKNGEMKNIDIDHDIGKKSI